MRQVARDFGVSLAAVQRWVQRARDRRLDRVDWSDRPEGCPRSPRRTPAEMEDLVLAIRKELKEHSALGEFGGLAIRRELAARSLERRGALDGRYRARRPAPPRGWYLPNLTDGRAELDSFDIVEGLFTEGGLRGGGPQHRLAGRRVAGLLAEKPDHRKKHGGIDH